MDGIPMSSSTTLGGTAEDAPMMADAETFPTTGDTLGDATGCPVSAEQTGSGERVLFTNSRTTRRRTRS